MTGPRAFWRDIKAGALRPAEAPAWVTENLRTRVSIGLRHIPGNPDHRPRRDDNPDEEAGK